MLAVASRVTVLAPMLVLLGLFLAPTLISGYLLATALTPPRSRTEAYPWNASALNGGAAIGSVVAGYLAAQAGATAAFAVSGGAAVALVAAAATRRQTLGAPG